MFTRDDLYVNNKPVNRGLFRDVVLSKYNKLYLEHKNGDEELPVLRDLYFQHCKTDPTEYTLAVSVFGSWEFWEQLTDSNDIKPVIDTWRKEIDMYLRSQAVQSIAKQAKEGSFQGAKWLYDHKFWDKAPKKKRSPKEDGAAVQIRRDLSRLGLSGEKDGNKANH
jgi:hypothetical protein